MRQAFKNRSCHINCCSKATVGCPGAAPPDGRCDTAFGRTLPGEVVESEVLRLMQARLFGQARALVGDRLADGATAECESTRCAASGLILFSPTLRT